MYTIVSLEFSYRSLTYHALVRIKYVQGQQQLHVTIMNGDLERALYGNHIFTREECIREEEKNETNELRACVKLALQQKLLEREEEPALL